METRKSLLLRWILPIVAVALLVGVWARRTGPVYVLTDKQCAPADKPMVSEHHDLNSKATDTIAKLFVKSPYQPSYTFGLPLSMHEYTPKDAERDLLKDRAKYGDREAYAYLACKLTAPHSVFNIHPKSRADQKKRESEYIDFMKRGQQLDPDNALYHLLMASCYWGDNLEETFPKSATMPKPPLVFSKEKITEEMLPEVKVANEKNFRLGLAEYEKALQKKVSLYIQKRRLVNARNMPKILTTEQYLNQREAEGADAFNQSNMFTPVADVKLAALWLAKRGEVDQALKLLQPKDAFVMMTANPDMANQTPMVTAMSVSEWALLSQYLLTKSHRSAEAERYGAMTQQIMNVVVKDAFRYQGLYDIPGLRSVYSIQVGWTVAGYIVALLWVACCVGQVYWYFIRRGMPSNANDKGNEVKPERYAYYCLIAIGILLLQPLLNYSLMPLFLTMTIMMAALFGIAMRYQYKQACCQAGVTVPSRGKELLNTWLPVLLAVTYCLAIGYLKYTQHNGQFSIYSLLPLVALLVLVTIPVMAEKNKTSEYYAKASQMWLRYLSPILVFISLVGLPLMTVCEAALLGSDQNHLGMFRSPEVYTKTMNQRNQTFTTAILKVVDDTASKSVKPAKQ